MDTPEDGKDNRYPERVTDQAKYFGVSVERAVQIGNEAEEFTARTLSAKPFTVYTLWQDAHGSSKKQRFYGFVVTDKGSLSSLLVRNGPARIYGKRITLPDGTDSRAYLKKLEGLKEKAVKLKVGGWGSFSPASKFESAEKH